MTAKAKLRGGDRVRRCKAYIDRQSHPYMTPETLKRLVAQTGTVARRPDRHGHVWVLWDGEAARCVYHVSELQRADG